MRLLFFLSWLTISASVAAGAAQPDSLQQRLASTSSDLDRLSLTLALSHKLYKTAPFEALQYAEQSVKLANKIKSDTSLISAYAAQANTYMHVGNYSKALELYHQVIQKAEQAGNEYWVAVANGNIGSVYYYQRDHKNALKFYLIASDRAKRHAQQNKKARAVGVANLLNNIGIIYDETGEYDKAADYYNQALALSRANKDYVVMANVLNNQGTLYRDMQNDSLAFTRYQEALDLRKKNNDLLGMTRSYHNLGSFYLEHLDNREAAEQNLKEAINLGQRIAAWQTVSSAASVLHNVYRAQGDYRRALEALELSFQMRDSSFNESSTRRIAQLEMQFEFDRQQRAREAEQKQRELYYWMGGALLALSLVIVTLLFILQRNKTRRSELEQAHLKLEKANLQNDLVLKDKELATNIMYLLNKNELINTISEKLLDIKKQVGADMQGPVHKVVLDLQSNLQPELWQEFEMRFQQVHENFYKTLHDKFPDLTPHDVRLCAFLKLNMTTKEISALTHQNAKSIDVARTRLRKKLNLTGTDQNLVTFLSQLDKTG